MDRFLTKCQKTLGTDVEFEEVGLDRPPLDGRHALRRLGARLGEKLFEETSPAARVMGCRRYAVSSGGAQTFAGCACRRPWSYSGSAGGRRGKLQRTQGLSPSGCARRRIFQAGVVIFRIRYNPCQRYGESCFAGAGMTFFRMRLEADARRRHP